MQIQVANIDERANEVSTGEIHVTDRDLVYLRPGKFPIKWPIGCIRRYGCNEDGKIFMFETGRQSVLGQAIYAFYLARGHDLVNRLKERIEKNAKISIEERESASTNNQNRSSFKFNRSCFNSETDRPPTDYDCLGNQDERPRLSGAQNSNKMLCNAAISETSMTTTIRQQSNSTYTDIQSISPKSPTCPRSVYEDIDLKPLPYSNINANVTQSLNELAKAHAANRQR